MIIVNTVNVFSVYLSARTVQSILHVIHVLWPYWSCFAYQSTATDDTQLLAFFRNIEIPKRSVSSWVFCLSRANFDEL